MSGRPSRNLGMWPRFLLSILILKQFYLSVSGFSTLITVGGQPETLSVVEITPGTSALFPFFFLN